MEGRSKEDEGKIEQLKEDMMLEWWRAGEIDDFNLRQKLLRVGCRPLRRKFLACKTRVAEDSGSFDLEQYATCKVSRVNLIVLSNANINVAITD